MQPARYSDLPNTDLPGTLLPGTDLPGTGPEGVSPEVVNPAPGRRQSIGVKVGAVTIGGGHPIVVQSMTNTDTADALGTVRQVQALAAAGSELVRITVNTEEAARQIGRIR